MRQSLRFLVSLSAAATVWGAGLTFAQAQDAHETEQSSPMQNTPNQPQTLPQEGGMDAAQAEAAGSPGYEPVSPYTSTTRTPMLTVSDPNEPKIDSRTTRTRRPNVPLLGTSSMLFLGSYIPTVIYQGVADENNNLYVPIAGPWMDLAQGHHSTASKTLLSLSGVVQGLGALGVVSSFFIPERKTRNWYLLGSHRSKRSVSVAPQAMGGSYGVGASGRF